MLVKALTLFTLTFSLFASAETVQSFDLNGDGIKDRFEYWIKDKLIRIEEDLNNDGKIDTKTTFTTKKSFKVEEQDTNFDGSFDRKKTFSYEKKGKIKIQVAAADSTYAEFLNSDQTKNFYDCYSSFSHKTIETLVSEGLHTISKAENGFIPTNFGYRIDQGCIDRWGNKFFPTVEKMISGGLKCLMDLHQKSGETKKISGSLKNAYALSSLMKKGGVSLVCSETKNFDWQRTIAHASTNSQDSIIEPFVAHPFISINPKYPESRSSSALDDLASTLFHEQLHNLGFMHGVQIEYAYTCEDCCLNQKLKLETKALACKICTGNYKNETDAKYVEDFVRYTQHTNRDSFGFKSVMKFMKENSKSVLGLTMLAYTNSDPYNPVGPELIKIIKARHPNLKPKESEFLEAALARDDSKKFNGTEEAAKVAAESLYELYYNKDGKAALDILRKNVDLIRKELEKKNESGLGKYPAESIHEVIQKVIYEMWLNKYPSKAIANPAYLAHELIFAKNEEESK